MEESTGGSGESEQDINTRDSHRRVSDMEATTSGPHPPAPEAFRSADEDGAELQPSTSNADGLPASARRDSKAIVVQGPDGALYVGNMNSVFLESKTETSGKADTTQIDQASAPFDFAPAADGTAPGLDAVHIIMPDASPSSDSVTIDIQGMDALFSPFEITIYRRRKQAFIVMVFIASAIYIVVFSAGMMKHHPGASCRKKHSNKVVGSVDCLSQSMLSNQNVIAALAFLTLYLSLNMVGFAGALVDSPNLLLFYIVSESCLTFASALGGIRPFLVFRLLIILLAIQLHRSLMMTLAALRRLEAQMNGQPMPPTPWADRVWNVFQQPRYLVELFLQRRANHEAQGISRHLPTFLLAFQRQQGAAREAPAPAGAPAQESQASA